MYQIKNFTTNDDIKVLDEKGCFQVIEYQQDLSVTPDSAATAYFSAQMNVRRRQLVCDLSKAPVTIQAGAMQWMLGNVNATTGIKGVGDMATKLLRGKASGESAIKPEYTGDGLLVLEPTFKHLLLLDAEDWGGSVVLGAGRTEGSAGNGFSNAAIESAGDVVAADVVSAAGMSGTEKMAVNATITAMIRANEKEIAVRGIVTNKPGSRISQKESTKSSNAAFTN